MWWGAVLLMGALWTHGVIWAASSPLEVIRAATQQATAVLENPAYKDEAHRQERIEKVWAVIEPYFDLRELSQRTLGVHWRERTPEEQREFVKLFTALIKQTYSSALTRYTSDVQFAFDQERVDGNFAEVDTRLINPSLQKTIPIQYSLHKVGGSWRVYDVVIENVSLVRNYRSQFNRILSRSSYADLLEDIKRKIAEGGNASRHAGLQ
jgi:phospholipid transport system substrate-binding protein